MIFYVYLQLCYYFLQRENNDLLFNLDESGLQRN